MISLIRDLLTSEDPTEDPEPVIQAVQILMSEAESALFYALMDRNFKEVPALTSIISWCDYVLRSVDLLYESFSTRQGKSRTLGMKAFRELEDVVSKVGEVVFGKIT